MILKNRYTIALFASMSLIGALSSCQNDTDYFFDGEPQERFDKLTADYTDVLTGAEHGWVGYYTADSVMSPVVMIFKFLDRENVQVTSTYQGGAYDGVTTYRLNKMQSVEITFESYSVLHSISEFAYNRIGGEFVFHIEDINNDSILLRSVTDPGYNNVTTRLQLKKATAEDLDLAPLIEMENNLVAPYESALRTLRFRTSAGANVYFDKYNRNIVFQAPDQFGEATNYQPIRFSKTGFSLLNATRVNGIKLKDFVYNPTDKSFVSANTGSIKITIDGNSTTGASVGLPVIYYFGMNNSTSATVGLDLNSDTKDFSSVRFKELWSSVSQSLVAATGKRLVRLYQYIGTGSVAGTNGAGTVLFLFVDEDGKAYYYECDFTQSNHIVKFVLKNNNFTFNTSGTAVAIPAAVTAALKPLLNVYTDSKGMVTQWRLYRKGLLNNAYSNYYSFMLIQVKDPSLAVGNYDFSR